MNYEKELDNIDKLCQKVTDKKLKLNVTAQAEIETFKQRIAYLEKVQDRTGKFSVSVRA